MVALASLAWSVDSGAWLVFRPSGAFVSVSLAPTAYAVGCNLLRLRGWSESHNGPVGRQRGRNRHQSW